MTTRLEPPRHAGSRDHARSLLAGLPSRMTGTSVVLDCRELIVGTPSFLDEVVKELLVVREADQLEIVGGTARVATLTERAATNRGVAERVTIVTASANGTVGDSRDRSP